MRASTSASQAWGSISLSLAVWMRKHDCGALAAAIRAREQPRFAAQRNPAQLALGGVVAQADAAIVEEAREDLDALEHIIHGLGHFVVVRELASLPFHPINELVDQRRSIPTARGHALLGR